MKVGKQEKKIKLINFELKLNYLFSKPNMRYEINIVYRHAYIEISAFFVGFYIFDI